MHANITVNGIEYAPIIKLNKWQLPEYEDGGEWVLSSIGRVINDYYNRSALHTKAGRRRATKELAERCAKMSKQRDLLEAWRDHLDPEWIEKETVTVYYIYLANDEYKTGVHSSIRVIGTVYMGRQTAKEICNALNNKEINLD